MTSHPSTTPGGRHTIYEVAKAAGVSIATVSRALTKPDKVSAATRDRVLAAIEDLNYVPAGAARSLAVKSNEAYGLILPELRGPYYAELLTGFESVAAERGASVVLLLTRDKPEVDLRIRRLAGRVDAIVVMGAVEADERTLVAVGRKVPVLALGGEHLGVETVGTENVTSARELTGHVLDVHRRRRLLFVGDPDTAPDARERHQGFVQAHAERGLAAADPVRCELLESAGSAVADRLASGDLEGDGAICANDELALSLQLTLQRRGLHVPGDLSVTGWDDQMAARYVTPGLTTVRQPVRELGRVAAERVVALLSGTSAAPEGASLSTQVVIRQSCGCP